MAKKGWCPFPQRCVPAPGEVGLGYRATCRCGKLVAVTARGLFAHHKPPDQESAEGAIPAASPAPRGEVPKGPRSAALNLPGPHEPPLVYDTKRGKWVKPGGDR